MQFEIHASSTKKRNSLQAIFPSIVEQVKLNSSRASVLVSLQPDCEEMGVTVPLGGNLFFIAMNSKMNMDELITTLSHEMIHVAQMAKGILKPGRRGGNTWAGRYYPKSTPYLDRPWEIQAFSRQELVARRALEALTV